MGQVYSDALARKHEALETKIEAETHRPLPDEVRLHALKREKLRIKEEMLATR